MKKLLSILGVMGIIASGSTSIMAMNRDFKTEINPNFAIKIDVPHEVSVDIGMSRFVIIANLAELDQVQVLSLDENIVSARLVNDNIEITGLFVGTGKVKVAADNAETVIITVNVNEVKTIEVAKDATIYVGQTTELKINNFTDLSNVTVKSANDEVATAGVEGESIVVTGGEIADNVDLIVSADEALPVTIEVTVKELETINVQPTAEVYVDETITVVIDNAADLTNLAIQSDNVNVEAKLSADTTKIQITGKEPVEETIIRVLADHAKPAEIKVKVNAQQIIEVERNAALFIGESVKLPIKNFTELSNINVNTSNPEVAMVTLMGNDIFLLAVSVGLANVTVSAEHAEDAVIEVQVNELANISVDKEEVKIYHAESDSVKITNFLDLNEVNVESLNENIVAVTQPDEQGQIIITGVGIGTTEIKITADKAKSLRIMITVNPIKNIDVISIVDVGIGTITSVKIENFQDLANVHVQSVDEQISIVGIMGDEIVIKGLNLGVTNLVVSADHALTATISVRVFLKTIDVNQNVSVNVGEFAELKINNFTDLTNVVVESNNFQVAMAIILGDAVVIKGIALGVAEVLVSADYALDVLINVTVK